MKDPSEKGTPMAYGYNTPNVDASLRYLLVKSSCEVESVEDNVQKTSFSCSSLRLGASTKLAVSDAHSEHEIQNVLTHPSLAGWLNRDKSTNNS